METLYVGIDVAKDSLEVVVRQGGQNGPAQTFANSPAGIAALVRALPKQPVETLWACLEATGQYGQEVAEKLHARGCRVSVVNPLCIKRYAGAASVRQQTDAVDAGLIAAFCDHLQPRLWLPPSPTQQVLRALSRRLADLQEMRQMERNRRAASKRLPQEIQTSLDTVIETLQTQIQAITRQMVQWIDQDPELKRQKKLLMSIKGIGELTAVRFLAALGDLRDFASAKQLSAFLGLTPESKTSGTSVQTKPKLSKKGNAGVRQFLYLPAVVAKRYNPIVHTLAERLAARQKPEMSIVAAAMHKLVHLMYGVVHSGLPFDPDYLSKCHLPS
jgi:transposase